MPDSRSNMPKKEERFQKYQHNRSCLATTFKKAAAVAKAFSTEFGPKELALLRKNVHLISQHPLTTKTNATSTSTAPVWQKCLKATTSEEINLEPMKWISERSY